MTAIQRTGIVAVLIYELHFKVCLFAANEMLRGDANVEANEDINIRIDAGTRHCQIEGLQEGVSMAEKYSSTKRLYHAASLREIDS